MTIRTFLTTLAVLVGIVAACLVVGIGTAVSISWVCGLVGIPKWIGFIAPLACVLVALAAIIARDIDREAKR